jgi:hypothetical protein
MSKIKLVQGDTKPRIFADLTDGEGGDLVDISGATSATLAFRAVGSSTILTTIPVVLEPPSTVSFSFPDNTLDVPEGEYEGELRFFFGADIQTIFKPLRFYVRTKF